MYVSLKTLFIAIAVFAPFGAVLADQGLFHREVIARGLIYKIFRHEKTVRDYSRLSNLVRSYPSSIDIHVVSLDPSMYRVRVLDAKDYHPPRCTVKQLVLSSGALCAINAGFYDEFDKPVGLHILGGKIRHPFGMHHKRSAAIFYRRGHKYNIISNTCYKTFYVKNKPPSPMLEAVQSYPLLVARGKVAWAWRPGAGIAQRSAIGITYAGWILMVVTDNDPLNGLSLAELAVFMAKSLKCRIALNLDGGPSSQLYLKRGRHEVSIEGHEAIRTSLAVFPAVPNNRLCHP